MQTLSTFFNIQSKSLPWASSITQSPAFAQAKQGMAPQLTGILPPKNFYEFLVTRLHKALNIDIGSILVRGWRIREEIIKYRHMESPSGKPQEVELFNYAFESRHSPTIQPIVNGVPLGELKFDIVVRLTTYVGKLIIQDGKIVEIRPGTCIGSGSIEYAGIPLIEKETAPLDLPGHIPLKPPISI